MILIFFLKRVKICRINCYLLGKDMIEKLLVFKNYIFLLKSYFFSTRIYIYLFLLLINKRYNGIKI